MTPQNISQTAWYDRVLHVVLSALTFIASIALCALVVITCIDVIGRYFLNAPLIGSTELTEMTLGVLVFTSLPIVSYHKKHIVVDVLDSFIPVKLKQGIDMLSYAVIAGGMYAISVYSEKLIQRTLRRELVTEYLEIPIAYLTIYAQFMGYVTVVLMGVLILKNILTKRGSTHVY